MDLLLISGALRSADNLAAWAGRLPGVRLRSLPAHGGEPAVEWSVEAWVQVFRDAVGPETVVVGESLAGLVALGLGAHPVRAVVAIDPPLTTAKLWPTRLSLLDYAARHPGRAATGLLSLFGYGTDGQVEDRIYYPLVEAGTAPIHIVTGTVPLHPQRPSPTPPCLVDDVDRLVLGRLPNVRFHTVTGSHLLMDENPDGCEAVIRSILADRG